MKKRTNTVLVAAFALTAVAGIAILAVLRTMVVIG